MDTSFDKKIKITTEEIISCQKTRTNEVSFAGLRKSLEAQNRQKQIFKTQDKLYESAGSSSFIDSKINQEYGMRCSING